MKHPNRFCLHGKGGPCLCSTPCPKMGPPASTRRCLDAHGMSWEPGRWGERAGRGQGAIDSGRCMRDWLDPAPQDDQPCSGERLLLIYDRWRKLAKAFYSEKKSQFDISKVPDIYDASKYDCIHNATFMGPRIAEIYQARRRGAWEACGGGRDGVRGLERCTQPHALVLPRSSWRARDCSWGTPAAAPARGACRSDLPRPLAPSAAPHRLTHALVFSFAAGKAPGRCGHSERVRHRPPGPPPHLHSHLLTGLVRFGVGGAYDPASKPAAAPLNSTHASMQLLGKLIADMAFMREESLATAGHVRGKGGGPEEGGPAQPLRRERARACTCRRAASQTDPPSPAVCPAARRRRLAGV